jgi:adenylate cyclase
MITLTLQRNFFRIIPFVLIWLVFGLVFSTVEYGFLGDSQITPSTGNVYNPTLSFYVMASPFSPSFGVIIGLIEVLFLSRYFNNNGLAIRILLKTAVYFCAFLVFNFIACFIIFTAQFDTNLFDPVVWTTTIGLFSTFVLWSGWIYAGLILGVCLFYSEISDNIGHGILVNFFTGKYHSPIEEERIFMFLDMKSSTTIAEEIGHLKYFELLKEFYADFTDSIINHSGEIYQYVGDEVVISWRTQKGLKNNNCLKCFFAMKNALEKRSIYYKKQYGAIPTFKAGMHLGSVTTGEIGVLKKEIIFTGDILNTTARIQNLCNDHNVDLLLSQELLEKLPIKHHYNVKTLGKQELKGKTKRLTLFSIDDNG